MEGWLGRPHGRPGPRLGHRPEGAAHSHRPLHHPARALRLPPRPARRDRRVLPRVRPHARTARSLRHLHPRRLEERRTGQLVAHVHGQLRRGRADPRGPLRARGGGGASSRVGEPQTTPITLPPNIDGGPLLDFSFQGEDSPDHYLIENRIREGFDRNLPSDGLLVNQVDEAIVGQGVSGNRINVGPTPGLRILEADANFDMYYGYDRGGANDPFPGPLPRTRIADLSSPNTLTFSGAPTNIALENITQVGRNVSVHVRVRAPGWNPPRDLASGAGQPQRSFGTATRSAVGPSGDAWLASSETVAGRLAVVVPPRPWLQGWQLPEVVDRGIGNAYDPTLARVGASDLVVAWIEIAGGPGQVCYRARVRGHWTTAHVLTAAHDGCLAPAVAADAPRPRGP